MLLLLGAGFLLLSTRCFQGVAAAVLLARGLLAWIPPRPARFISSIATRRRLGKP